MAKTAKTEKTVGVYDRPPPSKWPKVLAVIVALVVLAILAFVYLGNAEGAEAVMAGSLVRAGPSVPAGLEVRMPVHRMEGIRHQLEQHRSGAGTRNPGLG